MELGEWVPEIARLAVFGGLALLVILILLGVARRRGATAEMREWLLMVGKTALVVVGLICIMAGLVDLVVVGPSLLNLSVLGLGLALTVPPLAFAFRDALRAGRQGS